MQDFLSQLYQQFLNTSIIEWFATISGFLCVYLAAKQNIWNWPTSIISVCLYLYIFYHAKLYGDSTLQLYFLGTAIYGWYYWNKRAKTDDKPISSLNSRQLFLTILSILIIATAIGYLLSQYTDTDVPYIDGFCTAVSLVAQFLMTRKVLENWILWVFVDICYVPLYLHKDLVLTAVLYIAFAIIAWNGYRDWRKTYLNFQ
ncbi:nicotinamide riboside transporter PnuC [Sphingobacterium sp. DK4209]|uniref:Nicotinamide riboside transporter PnuC n=1 Tax=Sphingobacterium zhuxiongii TaxID=2662364 RepID=A0A5Q0QEC9_9SPHI|nr:MULTISPECIES: nicotinamide riboside transporter PnuC [unclassified Sphingobacterium]MVZ67280.1 nicotinamide riboside transporter PnuC [Sphingobacterium sp. DK4209]QGA27624.1 nicotinamide riboside transporter PnuC [Sphingobacterium sp. dk4302]